MRPRAALPALTEEDLEDLDWLSEWGHRLRGPARLPARSTARPTSRARSVRMAIGTTSASSSSPSTSTLCDWIRDILRQQGYEDDRVEVIDGGTDAETRELIRARFNEDPAKTPVRILLATDAAGEGIDLQHHCHRLVNFDIPFNPNRLEQRIGRVDRYGQTHAPDIRHFAPDRRTATARSAQDVDLLARVAVKIAQIMRDLGSANEIIAPDIQRQLGGIEVSARASAKAEKDPIAGMMRRRAGAQRRADAARAGPRRQPRTSCTCGPRTSSASSRRPSSSTSSRRWNSSARSDTDVPVFRLPTLGSSWEPVTRGLYHPPRPGQPAADRLRPAGPRRGPRRRLHAPRAARCSSGPPGGSASALWGGERSLERVSAIVVPGLEESFAVAVTRLVLVGRAGLRLHEEVFLAGTRLARRQAVGEQRAEELLEQALDGDRPAPGPAGRSPRSSPTAWNADGADGLASRVQRGHRRPRRTTPHGRRSASSIERREADRARVDRDLRPVRADPPRSPRARPKRSTAIPQLGLFDGRAPSERARPARDPATHRRPRRRARPRARRGRQLGTTTSAPGSSLPR